MVGATILAMRAILCGFVVLLLGGSAPATTLSMPPTPLPVTPFVRPIDGASVVRQFSPGPHRYAPGHRGVDLASSSGAAVLAAGAGTVVFAGMVAGRPVVSIQHSDALRTTYEPVSGEVAMGQQVVVGQRIGALLAGHPGCAAAACLHWGLRQHTPSGEVYLDPLLLLGQGKVRLKPLQPGDRGLHVEAVRG